MRIATRASALALAQAEHVAGLLGGGEIVRIATTGDGRASSPAEKSRWVDAIERALLDGEVDLAVHSAKDLPGELPAGLALLGSPRRAAAEDVICGARGIEQLPAGAVVGTSSLRRKAQLMAARPDLRVVALAGNVDTRLARLRAASAAAQPPPAAAAAPLHAVILARAGLVRLGREAEIGGAIDPARHVPAPGQGALALEGRAGESAVAEAVARITDPDALACLRAERALARGLRADCHTPLGAHARPAGPGRLLLRAWIGLPDGSQWISDEQEGDRADPEGLGERTAQRMRSLGAAELLDRAREMAAPAGRAAP